MRNTEMSKHPPAVITRDNRSRAARPSIWQRINAFLSLKAERTQVTYSGIIREWCRFLGSDAGTEEAARRMSAATDMHAIAYRSWLESRPGEKPRAKHGKNSTETQLLSPNLQSGFGPRKKKKEGLDSFLSNATMAKKFAALRRIYKMLIATSETASQRNPFDTDVLPPPPKEAGRKRPTEMLDFGKVKSVIEAADDRTPKGLRDRCILTLLFAGALRRSEVVNLRVGDVRTTPAGTVYVLLRATKAKKDAEQALPAWAVPILKRQVKQRHTDQAGAADYLFVSYVGKGGCVRTNQQISDSGVYKIFKRCCRLAGAGEFITPHSARATAITKLLADGIPHREVQEFSRHSSIQMVELYDKRRIGVDQNPARGLKFE